MQDKYTADRYEPELAPWKRRLCALLLASAIMGLFGVLAWFGLLAYSI